MRLSKESWQYLENSVRYGKGY